jgi:molecular chaperone DnaJ
MAQRDYYDILGVNKGASDSELKSAFRNLARKYHPDVSQEADAEDKFKEINEAYAVLSDSQKRGAYDRYGHAGLNGMPGAQDFSNIDLSDLFGDLFQGFGIGGFGRSRGRSRNAPRRGDDLQYNLQLTFEEGVFGLEREIEFARDETCSVCSGSRAEPGTTADRCSQCNGQGEVRQTRQSFFGSMVQVTTCPTCSGSGETISTPCKQCTGRGIERKRVTKMIQVPGGVDTGNQMRINGEGQPGANGGQKGNLYILISVKDHEFFHRREHDIMLDLNINVAQATLGADVEVPTVDGPAKLKIPAGIQPGKNIRMRGKGVPHLRGGGRGDQIILVDVEIPTRLTKEQVELFNQLADSLGSEVRPKGVGFWDRIKDAFDGF